MGASQFLKMDTKAKPRILVVDDEERNRRLLEAMLIPLGYSISLSENGKDALEKIGEAEPDLILLDIMMPVMDGYQLADYLKKSKKYHTIPIVMVTALNEVEDRVKALEAGADDFLNKPVDKIELEARVKSLLKVKAYNDYMQDYQNKLETAVARRTKQLRETLEKLKMASLDTIYCLSRAAEFRDEETGSHIQRMSQYSAAIARKMGLSSTEVDIILYAAPMHDIGKIGIPDSILLKPGKLTPDEWKIMKQHTVIGASIVENSDAEFLKLARIIALTHHEKWDGSGYPKGIEGDKIYIVGRITAIADVFDALACKRPYKEPYGINESLTIIKESSGSHFDPSIVKVFLSIEDEILAIKDKYKDGESVRMKNPNKTVRKTNVA